MTQRTVVGYGIGQYYEKLKESNLLEGNIKFDYLCDRRWEGTNLKQYDGISIISKDNIGKLKNPLVVVLLSSQWISEQIVTEMDNEGIECKRIQEIIPLEYTITGKELKSKNIDGHYRDKMGNTIYFDSTIPDNLHIQFKGMNNRLIVGNNVSTASLFICFGNNGICSLGSDSELIGVEIYTSNGKIEIGEKCLFSTQIVLRNHDGHHIFDRETKERMNHNKDILIGNQVWVCYRAMLLGGTQIGDGSVVGAGSIVTKPFKDHEEVAGIPARVVRENICWSREDTNYFDRDFFTECKDQVAKEFF